MPVPLLGAAAPSPVESLGRIAYVGLRGENTRVYTMRADGSERRLLTQSKDRLFVTDSVARGGTLLMLKSQGEPDHSRESLFLMKGEELSSLGINSRFVRHPSFSPDGRSVVFESDRDGFRDIYRLALKPAAVPERLTRESSGCFEPSLDPEGGSVVFVSSISGDPEIYRVDIEVKHWRRLTWSPGLDGAPRVSPDGDHIAFISTRGGGPRAHVMERDGGKPRAVVEWDGDLELVHEDLRWSPDGKWLSFVARRPNRSSLQVVFVPSGERVRLRGGEWFDQTPRWSPRGDELVFASNRDGDTELYRMRRDGSQLRRLTHEPGADWLPVWYEE